MKAWVLKGINDFILEDVDEPRLESDEVLVKVHSCGICGSDIPRIYKDGAHKMPLIPGHEFSGDVVKAGSDMGNKWIRKRVGVFPLIPCKVCKPCMEQKYEMCRKYSYLGSRRNGGFAEYVAVPIWNLIELPDNVTYDQAAMLEPASVAAHAIRQAEVCKDQTVAIYGQGTIGMLILMLLLANGIRNIYVFGNHDLQRVMALKLGLAKDNYCDARKVDAKSWIMSYTDNRGVDVSFECVGVKETYNLAVDCTSPGGMVCLVGNPHSDMQLKRDTYWKILRNQLTLIGSWNSSFSNEGDNDWNNVIDFLKNEKINPELLISHRYSIYELEKGIEIMRDKKEDYIKIMMTC